MLVLEAETASEIWASAWTEIATRGDIRPHARGDYREALHAVLALGDPRQRWTSTRHPTMNPAFALAEVIWILQGRNDSSFLLPWNSALPRYAGDGTTFHGAYGERLRSRFGFDQLTRAADALISSPEQRQVVLQIWDPTTDLPTEDGHSRSPDIPCNLSAMLKLVDGRLEWLQVMRSNDLIRGLPYNLVQWTSVQEVLAGWMSVDVGSYVHVSDSLHVYERDRPAFSPREPTDQRSSADLRLSRAESERTFECLESSVEEMAASDDVESVIAATATLPPESAYADWLHVLAAERLRRLKRANLGLELIELVRDPPLRNVARQWHTEKHPNP